MRREQRPIACRRHHDITVTWMVYIYISTYTYIYWKKGEARAERRASSPREAREEPSPSHPLSPRPVPRDIMVMTHLEQRGERRAAARAREDDRVDDRAFGVVLVLNICQIYVLNGLNLNL